ncbi:MAG: DUF1883 domain-containing protein [Acidimicrobiaceae bacterium]|nr:DUF1883 domain-containing protein [Acidimicrobiaceae bacterium]
MTKFLHSDLGYRTRGDVLEVTLSSATNVRLLDSNNFRKYQRGEKHQYYGGLARKSPIRIPVPSSGYWYVVVDMQGLRGSTRASHRVINGSALRPLPPIRDRRTDIAEIVDNASKFAQAADEREFDVFISHAKEDKDAVARPLAHALRQREISVWHDEFEL